MLRPVRAFLQTESASAVLLLGAAFVALLWANSPWDSRYFDLWDRDTARELGAFDTPATFRLWVNEGLMAVFFLVAGLELKRELTRGELASRRLAALPIAAALGGMVVPAVIYAAANAGGEGGRGWGIPMATDIAFALGVLAVLGRRVPLAPPSAGSTTRLLVQWRALRRWEKAVPNSVSAALPLTLPLICDSNTPSGVKQAAQASPLPKSKAWLYFEYNCWISRRSSVVSMGVEPPRCGVRGEGYKKA